MNSNNIITASVIAYLWVILVLFTLQHVMDIKFAGTVFYILTGGPLLVIGAIFLIGFPLWLISSAVFWVAARWE